MAAHLYKKNARWEESISLSKEDKLYKDAIETAASSNQISVAEDLLSYFVFVPSYVPTSLTRMQRYWFPRMLHRDAVRVLRSHSSRPCAAPLVARGMERLYDALPRAGHPSSGGSSQEPRGASQGPLRQGGEPEQGRRGPTHPRGHEDDRRFRRVSTRVRVHPAKTDVEQIWRRIRSAPTDGFLLDVE